MATKKGSKKYRFTYEEFDIIKNSNLTSKQIIAKCRKINPLRSPAAIKTAITRYYSPHITWIPDLITYQEARKRYNLDQPQHNVIIPKNQELQFVDERVPSPQQFKYFITFTTDKGDVIAKKQLDLKQMVHVLQHTIEVLNS